MLHDDKFQQRDEALAVLGHSHLARNDHRKALAAFDELLDKHPGSKHAQTAALNRAQVLYLAGEKPESIKAAESFLHKYPKSDERPTALYFLALARRDLDEPKEAAKTLRDLLAASPDSRFALDARLLLGQCLEATGDLAGAAEQYEKMLAAAPPARKADAQFSLGTVAYKAADYDAAIEHLSAMLKESPQTPYASVARLQLGLAHLAAGNIDDARGALIDVVDDDRGRANDARYGLAQCDIAERKFEAALASLDALASADPPPSNLPQVKLDRGICLAELGQHERAAAAFGAFASQHGDLPQAPEAIYRQAFSLHKLGKFAESQPLSAKVGANDDSPFAGPAAELDAENLFLLGRYPEAAKAFASLAGDAKDPDQKRRYDFRLGQCAYFAADYDGAIAALRPLAEDAKIDGSEELHPAVFLLGDALLQKGKNAEAAAALKKFLAMTKGDKLEAQFKLGLALLRASDADAAKQHFRQVSDGPSDSPWVGRALFELGQLAYKAKHPDEAAAALDRVASSRPPAELAAPTLYLRGWIDFDAKKYPEAAARFGQVAERHADHSLAADAAFQQGVALREAGKHDEAQSALSRYTAAHPQGQHAVKANQLRAASLTSLNRHEEAKQVLSSLAADSKGATDAVLYDLAWAHRGLKDSAAAADAYRRLLKQHPESKLAPAARTELAEFLYAEKKYDEAAALLEAVVADKKDIDPATAAAASYRLGWCYEKLDRPEKAAAVFAAYAKDAPQSDLAASALLQAGLAYAGQGKLDEAEKSLAGMLAKYPKHDQAPIALLRLGEVQADQEKFDASLATNEAFVRKHPTHAYAYRAHFGLGWARENKQQYAAARQAYEAVTKATNGETAARAQFQIGETFLAERKFEEAVGALLAVEDVYAYPKWAARALLEAGRAFEQLKQPDLAEQQYAQLVLKYKDAPEAGLARERLKTLKGS